MGSLISRVRDQAYDPTVHVRSPLPSHLPLPNPHIPNRPAVCTVVETFGESSVSIARTLALLLRVLLASDRIREHSARRCIPVGSARTRARLAAKRCADEFGGSVVSDARGLWPRHATPLHALLSQRYGASKHVFVRTLARPPTAYDPGDESSCSCQPLRSLACLLEPWLEEGHRSPPALPVDDSPANTADTSCPRRSRSCKWRPA